MAGLLDWIVPGLGTVTDIANSWMQYDANQKNIAATEKINLQNRNWALEDWNRQNEYNLPANQMARFKDAGLNPNLIYGQGTIAAPVRGTSPTVPQYVPFKVPDLADRMIQHFQLKSIEADLRNKEATNKLLQNKDEQFNVDMLTKILKNKHLDFDFQFKNDIVDSKKKEIELKNAKVAAETAGTVTRTQLLVPEFVLKKRKVDMDKARTDADIARIDATTAYQMMKNSNYQKLTDRQMAKIEQEIELLSRQNKLKQFEVDMRGMNLNPNDPTYLRLIAAAVQALAKRYFDLDLGEMRFGVGDMIKDPTGGDRFKSGSDRSPFEPNPNWRYPKY